MNPVESKNREEETTDEITQEPSVETTPEIALAAELEIQKDKYLRLFADFENFRTRTTKERLELFKTANQEVITALLPVLDDFDRAITEIKKQSENQTVLDGIQLIQQKLFSILKERGLTIMEVSQGADFDIDSHEAITQVSVTDESLKGKIFDVLEKGYLLKDKLIRFAKVVIGQ